MIKLFYICPCNYNNDFMKRFYFFLTALAVCAQGAFCQTTEEETDKTVVFFGDKDAYTVTYLEDEYTPDLNGRIEITCPAYSSMTVSGAKGWTLDAVTVRDVPEESITLYVSEADNTCRVFTNVFPAGITTLDVQASYVGTDLSFTASVVGDPSIVQMRNANSGKTVDLTAAPQKVSFEGRPTYDIMAARGSAIYNVEVNGSPLEMIADNYWSYTASNGDNLVVTTTFPEGNAPVKFEFDGCETDVITNVYLDGVPKGIWYPSFDAPLGSTVRVYFDDTSYENIEASVNGEPGGISPLSFLIRETTPYAVSISADKAEVFNLHVTANNPGSFVLKKGWTDATYTIDNEATEFDIKVLPSNCAVNVVPAEGYTLVGLTYNGVATTNPVYVEGDATLVIMTSALVRDKKAIAWLDPSFSWTYAAVTLSQNDYSHTKTYNHPESFPGGYTEIEFGDFDLPINVGSYPTGKVYLNDTKLNQEYGQYLGLEQFGEGSVLLITAPDAEPVSVTYDIEQDLNPVVTHHRISRIDNPGIHDMFAGTEIDIRPSDDKKLLVEANGVRMEANEEGIHTLTVTEPVTLTIKRDLSSLSVATGNSSETPTVYNLQGMRMDSNLKSLPKGIYIINGQKTSIR